MNTQLKAPIGTARESDTQALLNRYLKSIIAARVYDVASESALDPAPELSRRTGHTVLLKREDQQPIFSFKLRGAYNRIAALSAEERAAGILAVSAGNHAQGVALAAARLGIKNVIVMPQTTPRIKVQAVQALGGETLLHGDNYDEAWEFGQEIARERGHQIIHPYDDPLVIAGQGTIGMEILKQSRPDAIFIPVGGGGLLAGVAAFVKALQPEVKIIGVEPADAACMHAALAADERVKLDQVGIFADGVAVRQAGVETFRIARECVDEVILTSTDEICAAIKDVFDDTRTMVEPAGALAVAGLKKYAERPGQNGQTLIAILSGANVNFDRLRHVAERAELGEKAEAILGVTIAEEPGSFLKFCSLLGKRSVTEFNYRYAESSRAEVFVGLELRGGDTERQTIVAQLVDAGYDVEDFSENELAKLHVRHMVGGRARVPGREVIYRFQFPERPGALMYFLQEMGGRWNISMFHYRNHGAAFGRVLVGMEVDPKRLDELEAFLDSLGYLYWDETTNPAVAKFLQADPE